jgi:hypothetical protein
MSGTNPAVPLALPLITLQTRAYFAPVGRSGGLPTIFDPSQAAIWKATIADGVIPSPWVDLGRINSFIRVSDSKIEQLDAGMPAVVQFQTRQSLGAHVSFEFSCWSKASMALATSSQHMNVLVAPSGASPIGSGAKATPATALLATSEATKLYLAGATSFPVGSLIVIDSDYSGQTGYVGAGVSAGFLPNSTTVGSDPDVIRRLSWNVAKVVAVGGDSGMTLAGPLLAGNPEPGMKAQQLVGFVDREGGTFFQEWSGLFVMDGVQGDSLFLYYPRLQACAGQKEVGVDLAADVTMLKLAAQFRALPIMDGNDGEQVICYRTYVPGPVQSI